MQVLQLSHINVFKRKAIFVARMSPQKLAEKRQGEEISHFLSKTMDYPFGQKKILQLYDVNVFVL